jgi:methionyl-tRNA synthetase
MKRLIQLFFFKTQKIKTQVFGTINFKSNDFILSFMAKIFIGVAWPYADASLHLGHIAGAYLPADIFARFNRLKGNEVLMVSGSDEHGTPITITAEKEGKNPQALVDHFHQSHVAELEKLGISFDLFTRTTTENHRKVVQILFKKLWDKGYIYPKQTKVLFCPQCKRYLPDRYVEGICPFCGNKSARGDQCDECGKAFDPLNLIDPKCKLCGFIPEIRESKHLFFKLSGFEERIARWIEDKEYWKANVKHFAENWLKEGLRDRAITRDLSWGIPVPIKGFEDKTIYVWFDAVTGYLSASIEWASIQGKEKEWESFWKAKEVKHYYFLAKDNIPFHSIIWPAMLMGYDSSLNLPYQIPANEYLRLEGKQFSTSKRIGIWVGECLAHFNPDAIRYYLSINMPESKDADWKWEEFAQRNNAELVGTFGNLIHRVLSFTYKHFGQVPKPKQFEEEDKKLFKRIEATWKKVRNFVEACQFKKGIKAIMELAHVGNRYFDQAAPWNLIKEDKERCGTVLYCSLKLTKALALMLAPYLPFTAQKLWKLIGYKDSITKHSWEEALTDVSQGKKLEKPHILFEKIDLSTLFEHPFGKLDLRLAKILLVESHPNADNLWIIKVNLGILGERQLIAGLKPYYSKEQLLNQWVVVLVNLKPKKLRGISSEGMLLAAQDESRVSFLTLEGKGYAGEQIMAQGIFSEPEEVIEIEDFLKAELTVDTNGWVTLEGKVLKTKEGKIRTQSMVSPGARVL